MADELPPFRLPEPIMRASTSQFGMGHLVFQLLDNTDRKKYWPNDTAEWLCGHRLPPFQRPAVWTQAQKIRFIESAWLGVHLGTYVVNRNDAWVNDQPHPMDLWLIDGQQRLRAIQEYLTDVFPVFDLRYGELNYLEKRRFDAFPFACSIVHESSEAVLRLLYDRLNFGGTQHTEDQRATRKKSQKQLDTFPKTARMPP
jgi:hypothetical protein